MKSGNPGKLRIAKPPVQAIEECTRPGEIPLERNQATQEAAWRKDRIALAQCGNKHELLIDWSTGLIDTLSN